MKSRKILIIEDEDLVRQNLVASLEDSGYETLESSNGKKGLDVFYREHPDMVLTDLSMPVMGGLEVLAEISKKNPDVPVIVISGEGVQRDVIESLRLGAWNYIMKPLQMELMLHFIDEAFQKVSLLKSNHEYHLNLEKEVIKRTEELEIELNVRKEIEELLKGSNDQLQNVTDGIVHALAQLVDIRDPYTAGHQKRVASLSKKIAEELGFPDENCHDIYTAALLHDIGKISVPIEILSKPGKISEIEFNLIKQHSSVGADVLRNINFEFPLATIIEQHHERLDGKGYPYGLVGDEITIEAKIIGVSDVMEAMSSHRPYRPGLGEDTALSWIISQRNIAFDPEIVDVCALLFNEKKFFFPSNKS